MLEVPSELNGTSSVATSLDLLMHAHLEPNLDGVVSGPDVTTGRFLRALHSDDACALNPDEFADVNSKFLAHLGISDDPETVYKAVLSGMMHREPLLAIALILNANLQDKFSLRDRFNPFFGYNWEPPTPQNWIEAYITTTLGPVAGMAETEMGRNHRRHVDVEGHKSSEFAQYIGKAIAANTLQVAATSDIPSLNVILGEANGDVEVGRTPYVRA